MAKRKLRKPLLLQEEFAAGEVSNPNQNATPAVQTNPQTVGIDKIEGVKSGEEVIASFMSKASAAKGMGMMKKYGKLKLAANSNYLDFQKFEKTQAIDQKLRKLRDVKDDMKAGPAKEKAIAKIQKLVTAKSDADSTFDLTKEKASNALAEVDEKLKKLENSMKGKEKEIYDTKKREVNANVSETGLELKAKRLKAQGKEDAAKEAAADLGKMKSTNAEMRATIKKLEKEAKDMSDLDGQIERTEADLKLAKQEMDDDRAKAKDAGEEFDEAPYRKATKDITNYLITLKDQKAKRDKNKKNESEEVEEGNAFGAARAEAIAKGEDTFKVGDEEYPVEDVGADDKENAEEYAEEEGIKTEESSHPVIPHYLSVSEKMKIILKR